MLNQKIIIIKVKNTYTKSSDLVVKNQKYVFFIKLTKTSTPTVKIEV